MQKDLSLTSHSGSSMEITFNFLLKSEPYSSVNIPAFPIIFGRFPSFPLETSLNWPRYIEPLITKLPN